MASQQFCQQFLYLHLERTPPPVKARETILPAETERVALGCPSAGVHAEARSVRVCQLEDAFAVSLGT